MFIINVVPILRITLSLLQSSSFKSECFYILFHFSVVGENDKSEGSGPNAAAVAVPVVLLLLLIPAVVVAVFFYRRWVSTARKRYTRCSFSVKREKGKIERFIWRLKFPLTVYFFTSLFLSFSTLLFPAICRTLITYEANCDSSYVPLSSFYRRGRASERKSGVHFLEGDLVNSYNLCCRVSFSNKSQMTSKCGKNEKVAFEAQPSVSLMFFHILTSSVIYSWWDSWQHGIYLFYMITNQNVVNVDVTSSSVLQQIIRTNQKAFMIQLI